MVRIACLLVPLFPLAARLRSEPELAHEAVVIVEGNGNAARVVGATRRARKEKIRRGLTLPQARALLPKLIARGRDSECERSAQEALLEVAETFSPRVEDAGEGVVFLDITGMERHFDEGRGSRDEDRAGVGRRASSPERQAPSRGASEKQGSSDDDRAGVGRASSPERRAPSRGASEKQGSSDDDRGIAPQDSPSPRSPELRLAKTAIRAVEAIGLPVRIGIASSKLAARVAAELPKTPTIVPPGEESEFLAPLPLNRLTPELKTAAALGRWGIESIGELAKLPEAEVASRLGEIGREIHRAARGVDPRPLMPRLPPPEFREGMDLEWPLVALEPFVFVANAALDRLMTRLGSHGFACSRIELTLRLEPEGWFSRSIDLPAPTRDVRTILTLVRLDLESKPPGAPVAGFSFVAHPDRPRRAQLSLFGPAALSPDKLATTIARLVAMLGNDRVGMACQIDGYAPERFGVDSYDPPPPPTVRRPSRKWRGLLAVRVLRPPVALEVITENERLRSIRNAPNDSNGKTPKIDGTVRVASGPWSMEESWWAEQPLARQYWDIELTTGGVYRIFRDAEGWFADGLYD